MFLPSNGSDTPIPVGVVRGVGYDIREADDVCLSILGYSREEFARGGINWREITPAEYLPLDDAAFRQLMGVGGFTTPWQKEYIRKDGARVPVLMVGAREPESTDHWIGFVVDLTCPAVPRDHAVDSAAKDDRSLTFRLVGELVRERQRMLAMLDSTEDLIWSTDREFRLIGFNRAFQERVRAVGGRALGIGDPLMDASFPADQRAIWSQWYARAIAGERFSARDEFTLDGRTRFNEYRIAPINLQDEGIVGASIVGSDTTARHLAESALRVSEARFRTLTNASPLGIFITDLDGACVYCNPKLAEIFGTAAADLLGSGYTERMHPDDRDGVLAECGIAMQAGLGFDADYRVLRPDGVERHVRIWTTPIHNGGQLEGFAGTVEDDTEKRALAERLGQRERMESLGTLAGGVAHDFNNMLGIVLGHTELAIAELEEGGGAHGAEIGEHLREIQTASSRARDLVQQILSFSRRAERDIAPVDLGVLVTESMRLLRSAFPVSVEMAWQVPPTPVMVLGDATALQQVIVNLCTNAEHAMRAKGGGVLSLRLETDGSGDTGAARLTVSDTGTGMTAAVRARAFEPFFTTKAVGEGTGMGLAVVHGLVESYGGGLSLESVENEGTTVRVALPLTAQPTRALAPEAPEAGGVGEVLLVEDEPALARFAARALQRAGYVVTICEDGTSALARFRESPERFDIVLTDLTMPGMSGAQLATEFKRARPDLPIILMSGYSASLTSRNMHEFGVELLLQKPFKAVDLLSGVASILRTRRTLV